MASHEKYLGGTMPLATRRHFGKMLAAGGGLAASGMLTGARAVAAAGESPATPTLVSPLATDTEYYGSDFEPFAGIGPFVQSWTWASLTTQDGKVINLIRGINQLKDRSSPYYMAVEPAPDLWTPSRKIVTALSPTPPTTPGEVSYPYVGGVVSGRTERACTFSSAVMGERSFMLEQSSAKWRWRESNLHDLTFRPLGYAFSRKSATEGTGYVCQFAMVSGVFDGVPVSGFGGQDRQFGAALHTPSTRKGRDTWVVVSEYPDGRMEIGHIHTGVDGYEWGYLDRDGEDTVVAAKVERNVVYEEHAGLRVPVRGTVAFAGREFEWNATRNALFGEHGSPVQHCMGSLIQKGMPKPVRQMVWFEFAPDWNRPPA